MRFEAELVQFALSAFLPVHDAKVQHFSALVKFYRATHRATLCNSLIIRTPRLPFIFAQRRRIPEKLTSLNSVKIRQVFFLSGVSVLEKLKYIH